MPARLTGHHRSHPPSIRSRRALRPYARQVDRSPTAVEFLVAIAVGIGDGLVGQVHATDKFSFAHTAYRGAVGVAGVAGAASGTIPDPVARAMWISSVALLASRVPAAVSAGNLQQFG